MNEKADSEALVIYIMLTIWSDSCTGVKFNCDNLDIFLRHTN